MLSEAEKQRITAGVCGRLSPQGKAELRVLDRYTGGSGDAVELAGEAIALRMDPLGRYLLARPAHGDT